MADSSNLRFLLAVVSKDEDFSLEDSQLWTIAEDFPGSEVSKIQNNSENITVVYNRLIERALADRFDFLVMMHSDVEIDVKGLAQHIASCSGKYDIMGLCGCEKFSISESPLNWYCASRKYPEFRWGCVSHGELGDLVSFWNSDRKDETDHSVACIDGLCIAMSRKAMETGVRFDEKLRFNCYDTQISLDAVMKHGLRLGCLVERGLRHFSVGKSITTDVFMEDELELRNHFGFGIPPNSRIERYLKTKENGK